MDLFKRWASLFTDIGFSGLCDIGIVTIIIQSLAKPLVLPVRLEKV